jgi:hypothetical protein
MNIFTSHGREEVLTTIKNAQTYAFTGVNSKLAWRATRLQSIMHRSAQQNKTQECNGAHYLLCQSQERRRLMVIPPVVETSGLQECVGGTCKVL